MDNIGCEDVVGDVKNEVFVGIRKAFVAAGMNAKHVAIAQEWNFILTFDRQDFVALLFW